MYRKRRRRDNRGDREKRKTKSRKARNSTNEVKRSWKSFLICGSLSNFCWIKGEWRKCWNKRIEQWRKRWICLGSSITSIIRNVSWRSNRYVVFWTNGCAQVHWITHKKETIANNPTVVNWSYKRRCWFWVHYEISKRCQILSWVARMDRIQLQSKNQF